MKLIKFITLIIFVFSLQACNALKGKSDIDNLIEVLNQDNPDQYKAVMISFIESAKADNLTKMLSLTSKVTIEKMGLESLKKHYLKDTIPAIKACKQISEGGDIIHVDKSETGTGSGWVYRKTCTYGESKSLQIQFVILKEQGQIALTSFGPV